jgi:hypothetical protein
MRLLCAAAALALAAVPARAADIAQLGCPLAALTQAEQATIAREAIVQSDPAPGTERLVYQVIQCKTRFGWTEDERHFAFRFTLGTIAGPEFRRALSNRGIDLDALEAIVAADTVLLDALASFPIDPDAARGFHARNESAIARAAGTAIFDAQAGQLIEGYIAMVSMRESGRRHFASH